MGCNTAHNHCTTAGTTRQTAIFRRHFCAIIFICCMAFASSFSIPPTLPGLDEAKILSRRLNGVHCVGTAKFASKIALATQLRFHHTARTPRAQRSTFLARTQLQMVEGTSRGGEGVSQAPEVPTTKEASGGNYALILSSF